MNGDRTGLALPIVVAVLFALALLSTAGLRVVNADLEATRAGARADHALWAADAGAAHTLARWTTGPFAALPPGDSASTGWISLPGGASYRTTVLRTDDGGSAFGTFRLQTEGRDASVTPGRSVVITMVEAGAVPPLCCSGAIRLRGSLRLDGVRRGPSTVQVDGRDHLPVGWAAYCPSMDPGVAGVNIGRLGDLQTRFGGSADGNPLARADPALTSDPFTSVAGVGYADLVGRANVSLPRNARLNGVIGPRATSGTCDTSDSMNWGAPTLPGSACWDYVPVIYAPGNLRIDANGQGQGLLLVDGNLQVDGDFDFYGIVWVLGNVVLSGNARITGGMLVRNRGNGRARSTITAPAEVRYGSCAQARATAGLSSAQRMAGRHWWLAP